jgi:hypothetical protein
MPAKVGIHACAVASIKKDLDGLPPAFAGACCVGMTRWRGWRVDLAADRHRTGIIIVILRDDSVPVTLWRCTNRRGGVQPSSATESGEQDATGILERIRQDIGNYEYQAAQRRGDIQPKIHDPAVPPPPFVVACPASVANYNFDVTKIELTLQAIAGDTATGDVGLKVLIFDASLGPDLNGSVAHTRTKTVVLDRFVPYRPSELQKFHAGADYRTTNHNAFLQTRAAQAAAAALPVFPISDTLAELRTSLVEASGKLPCFDVAKGDDKTQTTADNKIVVSFAPHVTAAAKPAPK